MLLSVVFRADASLKIGTGHVVRCLTLADALRDQGAECQFACRQHEGHLMALIRSRGYAAHGLPEPSANALCESDLEHSSWFGVDWSTDAQETHQLFRDTEFDWLIVDHYGLDHRWESAMRKVCKRMMVIDDLADRRHDCDLLLDQNYGSSAERYAGLVPAKCAQLYGPEFALLQPIYAQHRANQGVRGGKNERVLIYFGGGADSINLTGMAMRAFQVPELMKIELDIVVGSSYPHKEELEAAAAIRGRTCIHAQLPDLCKLMARADLAIGAGGATTWERCCLGLPSIVISVADNQRPASEALAAHQLIQYLGHSDAITPEVILDSVLGLLAQPERLNELSEKGMKIVDGEGINRTLNAISLVS